MFAVQELTVDGWSKCAEHASKDNAFWHARARSDADGHTYRLISEDAKYMWAPVNGMKMRSRLKSVSLWQPPTIYLRLLHLDPNGPKLSEPNVI